MLFSSFVRVAQADKMLWQQQSIIGLTYAIQPLNFSPNKFFQQQEKILLYFSEKKQPPKSI